MTESIIPHLTNLRKLFAEAAPTDQKVVTDYAWTIVKALLQHCVEIDSLLARQLLADCLKLPVERPSKLYSALLSAAVKVANTYPEFRFVIFLKMWGIANLRSEDNERQRSSDGKTFPSLVDNAARALAHSLLLHPEDELTDDFVHLLQSAGCQTCLLPSPSSCPEQSQKTEGVKRSLVHPMLVTRIKQAQGKDGRKYIFVTLTSREGLEIETVSHNLQPHPLRPLPEGKRHYVNIGQLYDCLLRQKSVPASDSSPSTQDAAVTNKKPSAFTLAEACLSQQRPTEVFPTEIGYVESIDQQHAHIHVYDSLSRHFVAPVQRFSREKVGDFVRFIPITPATSKFKTAIIQNTLPTTSLLTVVSSSPEEGQSVLREIRITSINKDKGYAAWELTDKSHPITELLSPLQLSLGETSPIFTSGYLNLDSISSLSSVTISAASSSSSPASSASPFGVAIGQTLRAFIFLKRGQDRQKCPHIARLFFI